MTTNRRDYERIKKKSDLKQAIKVVQTLVKDESTTIENVLERISTEGNIPLERLLSQDRNENVSFLRLGAYFILREKFELSYLQIAKLTHRSDHTTVSHGYKLFCRLMNVNEIMNVGGVMKVDEEKKIDPSVSEQAFMEIVDAYEKKMNIGQAAWYCGLEVDELKPYWERLENSIIDQAGLEQWIKRCGEPKLEFLRVEEIPEETQEEIKRLVEIGMSPYEVAEFTGLIPYKVSHFCKENDIKPKRKSGYSVTRQAVRLRKSEAVEAIEFSRPEGLCGTAYLLRTKSLSEMKDPQLILSYLTDSYESRDQAQHSLFAEKVWPLEFIVALSELSEDINFPEQTNMKDLAVLKGKEGDLTYVLNRGLKKYGIEAPEPRTPEEELPEFSISAYRKPKRFKPKNRSSRAFDSHNLYEIWTSTPAELLNHKTLVRIFQEMEALTAEIQKNTGMSTNAFLALNYLLHTSKDDYTALFCRGEEFGSEKSGLELARMIGLEKKLSDLREIVARGNVRLATSLAKRYHLSGDYSERDLMDLIQLANLGLMRAIELFDYRKGYHFSTYAVHWVYASLTKGGLDEINIIRLPPHVKEHMKLIRRIRTKLSTGDNFASPETIATELGMEEDYIRLLEYLMQGTGSLNERKYMIDDNKVEAIDMLESLFPRQDEELGHYILRDAVRKTFLKICFYEQAITDKERMVIMARNGMIDGIPRTLEETALGFGVSRERVRQIEHAALEKIRNSKYAEELKALYGEARQNW
ncbi:sigma-70 family RNA polymerase sigma factor [Candidatus Woesearchaeota archaeon]|nr:sigma-70 family RNA polymerase sigma factor [Candidatus Woesearchaeota archaeon]